MKKFLSIMIIIVLSILIFISNKKNDVTVVQVTNEVIEYSELVEYVDTFQTGDIINIENTNYLSSYAIPGRWKHTVFYLGTFFQFTKLFNENDEYYQTIIKYYETKDEILVLDSNSSGVKIRTLDMMANLSKQSYLKAIQVYRFNENNDFIKRYLNQGLSYIGTPYDYSMVTYDDKAMYCSELIYFSLKTNEIEVNKTTKIGDHVIITPSDLSEFFAGLENVSQICLLEKHDNKIINRFNK